MAMESLHCYNRIPTSLFCMLCDRPTHVLTSRFSALTTSHFCPSLRLFALQKKGLNQRNRRGYPGVRALDIDQDTLVAVSVGIVSIAIGIGIPVFYEIQINNAANRENDQPCFPCKGSGAQTCRFCLGVGNITVQVGGEENEVSKCVNCEGAGSITCTTCQGTGIQPRYLDRREYKDDD